MKKISFSIFFCILFVLIFVCSALADAPQDNVGETLFGIFRAASLGWTNQLKTYAERLFWLLALIDLVWIGVNLAIKDGNLYDFAGNTIRWILKVGFFYALLIFSIDPGTINANGTVTNYGLNWGLSIPKSFQQIGGVVSAGSQNVSPSTILENSFDAFKNASSSLSLVKLVFGHHVWALGALSILLLIAAVIISGVMMLIITEMYVIAALGVLLLGLGGSGWTNSYAINYYKNLLAIGLKLLAVQLIGQITVNLYTAWANLTAYNLEELAALVIGLGLLAFLIVTIPSLISNLLSGGTISSNPVGLLSAGFAVATSSAATASTLATGGASGAMKSMSLLREAVSATRSEGVGGAFKGMASAGLRTFADNMSKPKGFQSPFIGGTAANMRAARQERNAPPPPEDNQSSDNQGSTSSSNSSEGSSSTKSKYNGLDNSE